MPRYRFGEFVLSPRRRLLLRDGLEQPLIPRYFDLLVFLVERRGEAVHRRDIFERIWSDVVVSDSALSQAIRTIRQVLGDDSREPRFVRTVSRHGYRFVFPDVVEEPDEEAAAPVEPARRGFDDTSPATRPASERIANKAPASEEPDVPVPSGLAAHARSAPAELAEAGRSARLSARGAAGGAAAGVVGGTVGGLLLMVAPGSEASGAIMPVLALVGGCCGAAGGAGVGAGLGFAESRARSVRGPAVIGAAAIGGALAGLVAQSLGRASLAALVGLIVDVGGALEGLAIGGAAGLAYVARGHLNRASRDWVVFACACGLAGLGLALAGRPLVGGTLHLIAQASRGAQTTLEPLGRLIGEPDFGPLSAAILATGESAFFGVGLAFGLRKSRS